jgi:hypothetical protein
VEIGDGLHQVPKRRIKTFAVPFPPCLCLLFILFCLRFGNWDANRTLTRFFQMREIAEIELAIQGGTEKIEVYGPSHSLSLPL